MASRMFREIPMSHCLQRETVVIDMESKSYNLYLKKKKNTKNKITHMSVR